MKYILVLLNLTLWVSCGHFGKDSENAENPERQADLYYAQGTQELVDKNYTESLKLLLKANTLRPKDTKILNNLGMSYYFKGKIDLALKYILSALEADPENWDARNNLASLYFHQGDIKSANAEYLKIKDALTYEHQYRVLFNLGLIEMKKGDKKHAKEYFEMSLKEKEDYCPSLFQIGVLEYKHKNYNKAIEKFHQAGLGSCYQWPAASYYQGLSFEKLMEPLKAKEKFQDVLTRFPESRYGSLAREKLEKMQANAHSEESYGTN